MPVSENIFHTNGFTLIKGFIDPGPYDIFFKKMIEIGQGTEDKHVPGSLGFYKNPLFEKLLELLLPAIEQQTGYSLYKTYSYARYYNMGTELEEHTDRSACEITVSICLDNKADPWPIWIRDKQLNNQSFFLEPGDALVFKGMELPHWRNKNTFGTCSQVFLHYVDQKGAYADERDDRKNDQEHY